MYKKIIIFFALLILLHTELHSQQYYFRKYSVEEGLPHSSVYCFMQDSRGFIWMGTVGGGIAKFDGYRFINYTTEEGLTDNVVRTLYEDSRGNIWIGTDYGLTIYDGEKFTPVTREDGLGGLSVLKITESSNGIIWIGTNEGGLSAIKPDDSLSITNFSIEDGLLSSLVYDIYEATDKRLWLAMPGGVGIIEISEGDTVKIESIDDPGVPTGFALSVAQTNDSTFLVGTRYDGLFTVIQTGKDYRVIPSPLNKEFQGLVVWDILVRPDGELWLATDENGIIRYSEGKVTGVFNRKNGFPSSRVMNEIMDNEGNTWFATLDHGAVMFRDDKFISYGLSEGITGNQVFNILFDIDNRFYIATEEGFTCFEKRGETIARRAFFTQTNGLSDKGASSLAKYDDRIWIGTSNGINLYDGSRILTPQLNFQLPDINIYTLLADSHENLWIGTSGGLSRVRGDEVFSLTQDDGLPHNEIQALLEDSKGRIWIGTSAGLARINDPETSYTASVTIFDAADGLTYLRINALEEDPAGNIWIGTFGGGIFKFDNNRDTVPISKITSPELLSSDNINSLLFIDESTAVVGTDKGFDLLKVDDKQMIITAIHFGINDGFTGGENNQNSAAKDEEGFIWFGTRNGLVRFDPEINLDYSQKPLILISGIKLFFRDVDWKTRKIQTARWSGMPENLVLSHKDNHITFLITGFFFDNPADLLFSYQLDPQSREWSPWSPDREIRFESLSPGDYTVKVRATNKYGVVSDTSVYSFIIKPPFYLTTWFIISSSILLVFLIFAFFRIRERNLIKEKIKLEKIVQERTRQVVEQKDEIARQRDVVTSQKKEITDSINYAERIQQAVLPDDSVLGKAFSEYFIILRPKDIVSGDFYWMAIKNDRIVFTAADCTGHGVPGAFMSMLGVSFLNKIVNESGITEPAAILNSLRENVISALKQTGSAEDAKDGMDIALCTVDLKQMKLWFAGANNPLYFIRRENGQFNLLEKKGDMMPVGVYSYMSDFTCHEIDIQKGDTIYLFSDGYMDQFGGPDGRKFMKTRFRQMLLDNQGADMASQKEIFNKTLEDWIYYPNQKTYHSGQVDDIILIGVRV